MSRRKTHSTLAEPGERVRPKASPTEVLVGENHKLSWVVVMGESWGQHVQIQLQRLDGTPISVVATGTSSVDPSLVALAMPHISALVLQDLERQRHGF